MKSLSRLLATSAAFVAIVSCTAPNARASTAVTGITIQFTTLEGGKAQGAAVSAFIQTAAGAVVAGSYDFAKAAFAAKSSSQEFIVPITHGPLTLDQLSGIKLTVQMQSPPGKTASWQFTYVIKVHLANGEVVTRQAAPCLLKSSSGGAASVAREFHL
jgi:hypothetical protein